MPLQDINKVVSPTIHQIIKRQSMLLIVFIFAPHIECLGYKWRLSLWRTLDYRHLLLDLWELIKGSVFHSGLC